ATFSLITVTFCQVDTNGSEDTTTFRAASIQSAVALSAPLPSAVGQNDAIRSYVRFPNRIVSIELFCSCAKSSNSLLPALCQEISCAYVHNLTSSEKQQKIAPKRDTERGADKPRIFLCGCMSEAPRSSLLSLAAFPAGFACFLTVVSEIARVVVRPLALRSLRGYGSLFFRIHRGEAAV